MLTLIQLGRDVAACKRVAHPRTGEAEDLRERTEHDHTVVDQPGRSLARILEVRLVDDERPRARQVTELAGRVVRPAADRQHRVLVADLGPCDPHGDLEHRVGRIVRNRNAIPRAGERARDEHDQVVCTRTEHDVLRRNSGVAGDRLLEPRIAAVRIGVDAREFLRKRFGTGRGQQVGRRVAVEANDLLDG